MKKLPVLLAVTLLAVGADVVSADVLTPVIINNSTAFAGFPVSDFIDGNILTDYASAGQGANTFVDFDFGSPKQIAKVTYTDRTSSGGNNGSGAGGPGDNVLSYNLVFRLNDANFGTAGDTTVGPIPSPGFTNTDPPVLINGGAGILARFVEFKVVTTNGANPGGAEIVFESPAGVPEPSTLLLAGLGGLSLAGYAWRRRRAV
jgi:hypothetical protein